MNKTKCQSHHHHVVVTKYYCITTIIIIVLLHHIHIDRIVVQSKLTTSRNYINKNKNNKNSPKIVSNDERYNTNNRWLKKDSDNNTPTTESTNNNTFTKCGFGSNVQFQTWFGTLFTDSPILYPTNDDQLRAIVVTAGKNKNCKVRVIGQGHSEDGVVMQKTDQIDYNVIIISLQHYIPDNKFWHKRINETRPSVRMSAGSDQLDLLAYIRPKGWLPATGTIGRLFSLGGVYMNPSTIGGWFDETRLSSHVLGVRIMHSNGTIRIYRNNNVIPFRGSMGLLGIVTAIEIKIRFDIGLQMINKKLVMANDDDNNNTYSTKQVYEFVKDIVTKYDGCNFFYFSRIDTLFAQIFDYNGNYNKTTKMTSYDVKSTQSWYDDAIATKPISSKQDYSDDTLESLLRLSAVTHGWGGTDVGKLIQLRTLERISSIFDSQSISPNDGYSSDFIISNFEQLAYFIKCTSYRCVDDVPRWIDITRTYLITNNYEQSSKFGDIQLFGRIFTVHTNERLLEHINTPGYYIGVEIQSMRTKKHRVSYSYHFKNLEDLWHTEFPGGAYHHGKAYAYGPITDDNNNDNDDDDTLSKEYIPFQNDTMIDTMYNTTIRTAFIQEMNKYDPTGVFRAGSMLRMLGISTKKYTIQQSTGDPCYGESNIGCLSYCCTQQSISFFDVNYICTSSSSSSSSSSKFNNDTDDEIPATSNCPSR